MTLSATAGVPVHEAGLASGLINTTRQVGGALGSGRHGHRGFEHRRQSHGIGDHPGAALTSGLSGSPSSSPVAVVQAVQAARAGEHGRGFAVVADEVKNLSEHTKSAALEVSKTLKAFNRRVEQMHSEAENSALLSQQITGQVSSFRDQFSSLSESAKASVGYTIYAKDKSFGLLTKLDHIVYKQNAYIALENSRECPQQTAIMVDNHNCRLGKWYFEGLGYQQFRTTSSYSRLDHPHHQVHSATHHAYEISRSNWVEDPKKLDGIIDQMRIVEQASAEVMLCIDGMIDEKIKLAE